MAVERILPPNIQQLVNVYRKNLEKTLNLIKAQRSEYRAIDTEIETLRSKLQTLQDKAQILMSTKTDAIWNAKTTTTTDATVVTATATNKAAKGVYDITINQLAKVYTYYSRQFAATGTDIADQPQFSGTTQSFRIRVGTNQATISVNIAAGETNEAVLQDISDAINASGLAVAGVVETTPGNVRLTIQSKETGGSNVVLISDDTDTATTGLAEYIEIDNSTYNTETGALNNNIPNRFNPAAPGGISGTFTFSVSINGITVPQISVTVNSPDDNWGTILNNIANAIESSPVRDELDATVVETAGQIYLWIRDTGGNDLISIEDISGDLAQRVGIITQTQQTATNGGYVYKDNELYSIFTVNNLQLIRESNEVSDAIPGVTLNLKKAQTPPPQPVTIKVLDDYEAVKGAIQDFLDTYNATIDYLKSVTGITQIDENEFKRGVLADFGLYKDLARKMRALMANKVDKDKAVTPNLTFPDTDQLFLIGITADDYGHLSITDENRLKAAFEDDVRKVSEIFTFDLGGTEFHVDEGKAKGLYDLLQQYLTPGGYVDASSDTVTDRIEYLNDRIEATERRIDRQVQAYIDQLGYLQSLLYFWQGQYNVLQMYYGLPAGITTTLRG